MLALRFRALGRFRGLGLGAIVFGAVALTGCPLAAVLEQQGMGGVAEKLKLIAPDVSVTGVGLVQSPSKKQMAAHFCPQVVGKAVSDNLTGGGLLGGLGALGSQAACSGFFGSAPVQKALAFAFDVGLNVENPNQIPVPMGAALLAVELFPETRR